MLPYPNPHRFWISQEAPTQQAPNPTFAMPPTHAHLDQNQNHIQHYDHFFPGHGQHFNSETLEAVLRPRPTVVPPATGSTLEPAAHNAGGGVAAIGHGRPRKRPFRTDRHSKIRTAQGVRDRRMRLSLDVARDFFALQDQLGFDKASKTVDWLLTQSKPAIERLSAESSSSRRLNVVRAGENQGKETEAAAGSGKGALDVLEKAMRARSGGGTSLPMEHTSCEMLNGCGRLVSALPMSTGEYYYDLGELMLSNNGGGEGDDDGEYEEDGDFLDGMQY
ncbi:uncharacterized protein LOC100831781 [Brachypodium distachyon]|uniref:TCP domain-containing protein n=1 Tax=Brachypodium distachyon TaxID=15368 RepID=A0A0Q3PLC0_BRADI|nr:uncharacterized protein LOC100831781 [Brachypodium distachyon]KQJ90193.1 hypothetical protein BRADI_4g29980v3 [Brachypodium distachyon]|eukprot:XP_003578100.1 uncharacterized protein LOC100831781 [Brachypodium distachyon]